MIDGQNKEIFYIFDLCGNFEFFRLHSKGCEASTVPTLQERTFNTKVEMVYKLQELSLQTAELQEYRKELVASLVAQIKALPRDNFAVKQHLRVIDKYQSEADFTVLEFKQTQEIAEHVAPLVLPLGDDPTASRFDQLVYQIELAMLTGKTLNVRRMILGAKLKSWRSWEQYLMLLHKKT